MSIDPEQFSWSNVQCETLTPAMQQQYIAHIFIPHKCCCVRAYVCCSVVFNSGMFVLNFHLSFGSFSVLTMRAEYQASGHGYGHMQRLLVTIPMSARLYAHQFKYFVRMILCGKIVKIHACTHSVMKNRRNMKIKTLHR